MYSRPYYRMYKLIQNVDLVCCNQSAQSNKWDPKSEKQDLLLRSNWKHYPTNLSIAFLYCHAVMWTEPTENIFLNVNQIKPFWFLQLAPCCIVLTGTWRAPALCLELTRSLKCMTSDNFTVPILKNPFWYNFSFLQINDPALQRLSSNIHLCSGYRSPWIKINALEYLFPSCKFSWDLAESGTS